MLSQDLIDLIKSYPASYSPKEVSAVVWAETGHYVNDELIASIRF